MTVPAVVIHQLSISENFGSLSKRDKLYAHYMSRAAWHGSRIILRQVSPESPIIFDFILELYRSVSGDWETLVRNGIVEAEECEAFLDYAARFLSNVGNYYVSGHGRCLIWLSDLLKGHGDQKILPGLSANSLRKFVGKSSKLATLLEEMVEAMTTVPPYCLGYPSKKTQTTYYLGDPAPTKEEVRLVSRLLEERSIYPENTRIRKLYNARDAVFEVLQASADSDNSDPMKINIPDMDAVLKILKGDHTNELAQICSNLHLACEYAANDTQKSYISQLMESFESGDLEKYRTAQETWIKDKGPSVENIFGFVEPYRDPHGVRAEFEGVVAIKDSRETAKLSELVEISDTFIKRLPWARAGENENTGKGPFEKELFEPPDFTSIHALAYCSSILFAGVNLPNYNDIRERCGFKNVIIANRMSAEGDKAEVCPFIDPSEAMTFQNHKAPTYYWWVVLHELFGHGTGKMMVEESNKRFNFDNASPPINPLTEEPISSWYKPGETWTGKFGDIATSVDECRAELVGACLMDDEELLEFFGYNEKSNITAANITYNLYQQLGVDGIRALANYNAETCTWGQAHSRAHFAMLRWLLQEGKHCLSIEFNSDEEKLLVRVDQAAIKTGGKPALEQMLLYLHIYRCTADVQSCQRFYGDLSKVEGEYLDWRGIVLKKKQSKKVFVQANTFFHDGEVILKEYAPTAQGIVQSWAERGV